MKEIDEGIKNKEFLDTKKLIFKFKKAAKFQLLIFYFF